MRLGKGQNEFNRTVTDDQSVLCYVKYVARQNAAGTDVTAATVEVSAANLLRFAVNGAAEVGIGTYTGNSGGDDDIVFGDANVTNVKELIAAVNGQAPGQPAGLNRWRASPGDFRPGFVIGSGDGLTAAAANALLGEFSPGLAIFADSSALATANTLSVGVHPGHSGSVRGSGMIVPDHFESDRTVTTAGVVTRVRAAGRRQIEQVSARLSATIDRIVIGAVFATTKLVRVYDSENNLLWEEAVAAGFQGALTSITEDSPIAGAPGRPLFVELSGTGVFTDGALTVHGFVNRA